MREPLGELLGARVQRIDGPRPDLFVLTLHRADRHGCLLLRTAPGDVAWGWVGERPRGEAASSFVRLLRKHLENGRVVAAIVGDASAQVTVRRGEREVVLRLERDSANLVLVIDGEPAGALRHASDTRRSTRALATDLGALEREGPALLERAIEGTLGERRRALAKAIARRRARLVRRLTAIEGDLARADEAPALRDRASLILAHLHAIPARAREAIVTDWNADPPAPIRIAIDPARGPRGEAEALFRRARKLARGGEIALERHVETEAAIAALDALASRLAEASEDELAPIEREAARLGARVEEPRDRSGKVVRAPYRTFRASGDRLVLVGRSAQDNDALTLRHARPYDHWLHARGVPGSHVVVPLERDETCPSDLLVDAAHLAAHFSGARGEALTEVQHTPRRYVRKARGAPPGSVALTREKVIVLRVDPDRLARLLASEDHA